MICKERGLLDFDKPISTYVEGFSHGGVAKLTDGTPVFVKEAREITLADIFTHTSGYSGMLGSWQFERMGEFTTLSEFAEKWNGKYLEFSPAEKNAYSPILAFELAALAVERVTGKSYDAFLKEEVFDKLGMVDTTYTLNEEQRKRLVEPYVLEGDFLKRDWGYCGFHVYEEGYTGGSAGLFSTLDDYLKFGQMLANGGIFNGVRVLSEESVAEMSTVKPVGGYDPSKDLRWWGYSLLVRVKQNYPTQPLREGSFGWSGAYGTHFWVNRKSGIVAVFMLNKGDVGGSDSPYSAEFERLVEAELTALGV
jgi:CubicO group peptidase (beta-lactamase class C family)